MLKGKAAVVTGSTSGIGLGIARQLAASGADLVLNGFGEPADIERLRASLAADSGVRVVYVAADLSRPDEAQALIERATRELGRVDIVVNNAGIQHVSPVKDFPLDKWEQVIAINLTAVFMTTRAALECATTGITCNAICPGWVLTPLVQKQIDALAEREKLSPDDAKIRLLGEKQPSLEFTTPEQLGALAVFLCSDAAAQLNGVSLPVDGGWTAR